MGFSTVAASIIIFAGLLFLAGTVANAVFESQRDTGRAEREKAEIEEIRRNTAMGLNSASWQGNRADIYLQNTGDSVLDVSKIEIFIDGLYGTDTIAQTSVAGKQSSGMWAPEQELYLRIEPGSKPVRIYVVTETGVGITVVL